MPLQSFSILPSSDGHHSTAHSRLEARGSRPETFKMLGSKGAEQAALGSIPRGLQNLRVGTG